jgi:hypothetical protein
MSVLRSNVRGLSPIAGSLLHRHLVQGSICSNGWVHRRLQPLRSMRCVARSAAVASVTGSGAGPVAQWPRSVMKAIHQAKSRPVKPTRLQCCIRTTKPARRRCRRRGPIPPPPPPPPHPPHTPIQTHDGQDPLIWESDELSRIRELHARSFADKAEYLAAKDLAGYLGLGRVEQLHMPLPLHIVFIGFQVGGGRGVLRAPCIR